jgi:hypothetical protein
LQPRLQIRHRHLNKRTVTGQKKHVDATRESLILGFANSPIADAKSSQSDQGIEQHFVDAPPQARRAETTLLESERPQALLKSGHTAGELSLSNSGHGSPE